MGEVKLVTVSSSSHCQDVLDGIWRCFVDKFKVDVEITCNGHSISVHHVLLAAVCPTLIKEGQQGNKAEHGPVSLNLDHVDVASSATDMECAVEFMYRGQTTCTEDRLDILLSTARALGLKGLVDAIGELRKADGEGATNPVQDPPEHDPPPCPDVRPMGTNRRKRKRPPVKIAWVTRCPTKEQSGTESQEAEVPARDSWGLRRRPIRRARTRPNLRPRRQKGRRKTRKLVAAAVESCGEEDAGAEQDSGPEENDGEVGAAVKGEGSNDGLGLDVKCEEDDSGNQLSLEIDEVTKSKPKRTRRSHPSVSRSEYKKMWRQNRPPLKCPQCHYETRDKDCYKSHLAKHDPSAERYVCDVCSKKFRSKRGFACHRRSHLDPNQLHKCLMCDFHTPQKSSWVQHLAVIHKVDRQGNALSEDYKCPECDFVCVAEHKLKVHVLRKHSTDKPFKCSECEYATFLRYDLDKHVSIRHRHERPYMCEMCGFRSQTQSGYERHKRSHTGEKPFKCPVCGQAYADGRKLKIHVQRHVSDEKPFVCHLCGHACRRKDNLQMHLKRIHKTTLDGSRPATYSKGWSRDNSAAVPLTVSDTTEENSTEVVTQSYILPDSVSYIPITYVIQPV